MIPALSKKMLTLSSIKIKSPHLIKLQLSFAETIINANKFNFLPNYLTLEMLKEKNNTLSFQLMKLLLKKLPMNISVYNLCLKTKVLLHVKVEASNLSLLKFHKTFLNWQSMVRQEMSNISLIKIQFMFKTWIKILSESTLILIKLKKLREKERMNCYSEPQCQALLLKSIKNQELLLRKVTQS